MLQLYPAPMYSSGILQNVSTTAAVAYFGILLGAVSMSILYLSRRIRRSDSSPFDGVPLAPGAKFLLGHLSGITDDFRHTQRELFEKNSNEYGQVGIWVGWRPVMGILHMDDARTILTSEIHRRRIPLFEKHQVMFLGSRPIGILTGREWKFHRSFIQKALTRAAIGDTARIAKNVSETLVESIKRDHLRSPEDSVTLDLQSLTQMLTLDVFGLAAFSKSFGSCEKLKPSETASCFDLLGKEMTRRIANPLAMQNYFYSIPCKRNFEHRKARMYIRNHLREAISERRKTNRDQSPNDLLSLILEAHEESRKKTKFDPTKTEDLEAVLSDTLLTLLFAGYDTTSLTLTYAFYLVATNPNIEKECLEEIQTCPDNLVYIKGFIMEVLRMYPPAPMTARTLQHSMELQGGRIAPAGTQIMVLIWLIQNDEATWPNPATCRPDRWVRRSRGHDGMLWVEREETDFAPSDIPPANRKAWLPFSAGSRNCPGQRFAMQEAVVSFAAILKEFSFSPVPGYELEPVRIGLVQGPRGGMPLQLRRR